jgi:hypothetical protein
VNHVNCLTITSRTPLTSDFMMCRGTFTFRVEDNVFRWPMTLTWRHVK